MADAKSVTVTWTHELLMADGNDLKYLVKWIRVILQEIKSPDEVVSHNIVYGGKFSGYTASILVKRMRITGATPPL